MYLTQSIRRAAQINPGGLATLFAGRSRTWAQVAERIARFAGALRDLGVQSGDRVAMLSRNRDDYIEWYYAIPWAGAISVPVNFRWSVQEMAYSLIETDARVLIVDDMALPVLPALLEAAPAIRLLIHSGEQPTPPNTHAYEELIRRGPDVQDAERGIHEPFAIFYTGGTSGRPKGVTLSSLNLWSSAMTLVGECALDNTDRFLHAAPMFHLADAAHTFTVTLVAGGHVVIPGFAPDLVLAALGNDHVSRLALVPTMLQSLLAHPQFAQTDVSALKSVVYGASPISETVLARAFGALPQARFIQAYGQTELSPIATLLSAEFHSGARGQPKLASAGRATCGTEVRIVGPEGNEQPRGKVGEIVCRGPNAMLGYWNNPDLTAKTLIGGWVHTGDAGYMDADGFVYVVDRLKDMIISGGENVYSSEVENVLMQHPAVDSCAVVGIPDERWGEAVHAVVVARKGARLDEAEVIAHCRTQIAHYKCPKSLEVRDALPLSAAGKILKRELREQYWQGRQRRVN
ncbi:MAG TPA: long-chain fatty acid--CoA ligase [Steroidobacteraceae bacterium]|nr:long-chain fatty acid--CoA ligase [Steroidobacteraceae bacterium]